MMGILDDNGIGLLNGLPRAWQYQNPQDEIDRQKQLRDSTRDLMTGIAHSPEPSPFGPIPQFAPPRPPTVFDTGSSPAAFVPQTAVLGAAGQPQQPTPSQQSSAAPMPLPRPRPSPAPRYVEPPDYGQTQNVKVGTYRMPMFGRAESAASSNDGSTGSPQSWSATSRPGFGDRAMAGLSGLVTNAHTGPIGTLLGGLSGFVTGQRSDPAYLQQQQKNLTEQALLAKGVAPQDVQAALVQPALLQALINQHFGPGRNVAAGMPPYGPGRRPR
jgi:hypothetical protein